MELGLSIRERETTMAPKMATANIKNGFKFFFFFLYVCLKQNFGYDVGNLGVRVTYF